MPAPAPASSPPTTSVAGPPGPPAQAPGGRAGVANSSSVPSGASEDRAPDPEEDDTLYRENVPGLFGALGGAIAILGGTTTSGNMNTDEVSSKRGQYNDPEKSSSAEQVFSNALAPGFLSLDHATRNINGAEMKMKKKKKKKKEINDTASSVLSERGTKAQIISSSSTVEYYSVSSRAVVPKAGLDFISGRSSSSSSSSSANGFTRVAPTGSDEINLNAIGENTNANTSSVVREVNMSKSCSSSSSLEEDQTNHDDLVNMYEDDAAWLRIQGQQGTAGVRGSSGPSRVDHHGGAGPPAAGLPESPGDEAEGQQRQNGIFVRGGSASRTSEPTRAESTKSTGFTASGPGYFRTTASPTQNPPPRPNSSSSNYKNDCGDPARNTTSSDFNIFTISINEGLLVLKKKCSPGNWCRGRARKSRAGALSCLHQVDGSSILGILT